MQVQEFIKHVNTLRLQNKNSWYYTNAVINGRHVQIKAYGTWLQIFRVDDMTVPTGMDMNVTQFKTALLNALEG